MMTKYLYRLFSMPLMAVGLLFFAAASGIATFVEDIYGTPAAKAAIYNALWFEILLSYLTISLILNVFRYKLYTFSKIPIFLFHISFVVIMIGAALTRYVGIDGMMHIREGKMTNIIQSTDQFFKVGFDNGKDYASYEEKVRISALSQEDLSTVVRSEGQEYHFKTTYFQHEVAPVVTEVSNGAAYLDVMMSFGGSPVNLIVREGEVIVYNSLRIGFKPDYPVDFEIMIQDGNMFLTANRAFDKKNMFGQGDEELAANQLHAGNFMQLYQFSSVSMVIRAYYPSAKVSYAYQESAGKNKTDALLLSIEVNGDTYETWFTYGGQFNSYKKEFLLHGQKLDVSFGPTYYELPFFVYLDDFIIHRYPASESPSSFDSHVSVMANETQKLFDYHIYMNHVLHYEGWRFFQSSYDEDELGSILSVTNDEWGIRITYLGYILLALTMILSLFWKGTSFRAALRKLSATRSSSIPGSVLVFLMMMMIPVLAQAEEKPDAGKLEVYDSMSDIVTIDPQGRIKPLNTLFYEVSRKVIGKGSYDGMPAYEFVPDVMFFPEKYYYQRMITIEPHLAEELFGEKLKAISVNDLLSATESGTRYLLRDRVNEAFKKAPADRSIFDSEIIKLDERANILIMLQQGEFLKVFPDIHDPHRDWYNSSMVNPAKGMDSIFIRTAIPLLFESIASGNYEQSKMIIQGIKDFQRKYAAEILPSQGQLDFEIRYERWNLFSKLALFYGMMSLLSLIFIALSMFIKSGIWRHLLVALRYAGWGLFLIQGIGLGIRWYISGHAPFSNGYEAMLYVSWIGLLIGLILSYRNHLLLFAGGVFAAAPLLVAHLNLMSPELTNLVPVLKSYWLTIHVATITTSYAVFGFIAMVAFLNLIIMAFLKPRSNRFDAVVDEFTTLNSVLLPIALFLITIGCFLGGVWANESWGTYWSWDPKETWCLVSILVYSFIAHMHHIKGLHTRYYQNLFLFLAFSVILMTYFGVNYFLGGMHSYGKGAAFDFSPGLWAFFIFILGTSLIGFYRETAKK